MSVNLGRVAYVEKGKYKSDTTYESKDVVSFNGGSYVYIGDTPAANVPPTDEAHWQPLIDPTAMNNKIAEADSAKEAALTAAENAEAAAVAANEAASAAENALAEVEDTLASIQEDYTELAGEVDQLSEEINISETLFDTGIDATITKITAFPFECDIVSGNTYTITLTFNDVTLSSSGVRIYAHTSSTYGSAAFEIGRMTGVTVGETRSLAFTAGGDYRYIIIRVYPPDENEHYQNISVSVSTQIAIKDGYFNLVGRVERLEEKEYEFFSAEKNELVNKVLNDIDSKTFAFLWSSDNHYNETVRSGVCQVQYAEEMAEIAKDIGVDCIVNTGDICASDHDDTGETPDLNVNRSRMKDIVGGFIKYRKPFMYALGHHELYPFVEMENGESKYAIDKSIICNIGHQVMNYRPYMVYQDGDRSKPNFYTDVTDKKNGRYIRMIFLDGTSVLAVGYSYNTIKFLESALASVPNGYSVMCFSHTPTRASAVGRQVNGGNVALAGEYLPADVAYNGETIESVIEAFIAGGGNFIGFFHGHTHCDNIVKDDDMGFSLVSIACQMVGTANGEGITSNENLVCYSGRNEYYLTAYCFDIVCVHPDTRTINLFRFGVGNDRTITY